MNLKELPRRKIILAVLISAVMLLVVLWFRIPIWEQLKALYEIYMDREQVQTFITSFGAWAPVIFILIQILQVLFAPVPGEVTGFIGGFLFGVFNGFIYSSIGLTLGSWFNFLIGRFLGKRYVRKLIPVHYLDKFDHYLKHQGVIVLLVLFIFPGFPKDYLCLFLGLSALPIKVFMLLTAFGRMPGTLILSFQGAYLFEQNYLMLAILILLCIGLSLIAYRFRERLYAWVERLNNDLK